MRRKKRLSQLLAALDCCDYFDGTNGNKLPGMGAPSIPRVTHLALLHKHVVHEPPGDAKSRAYSLQHEARRLP